jgi:hypothetical protein
MAWLARSLGVISESRASDEGWDQAVQGDRAKRAASAEGTTIWVTARESLKQDLPWLVSGTVGLGRGWRAEKLSGAGEEPIATHVSLESEVTDSDETTGQHVEQESAHKVRRRKRELLARIPMLSITIAEGDLTVLESDDAFIADCDAMSVATQVAQHLFWASHRRLAVDDPFLGSGLSEQATPQLMSDSRAAALKGAGEEIEQFASKHFRENADWKQETWARGDPLVPCSSEAAPGHDAVDVRVEEQRLGPGVKHGDRTWCRAQPSLAHGVKSSDRGLEKQRVTAASIGQEQRVERRGNREDQVEVGYREKVLLLRLDPACLLQTLALRAMPVPAGVVERLLATTLVADLEVAAQKRRSTRHDVSDYSTTLAPEFLGWWRMRPEDFRQIG